MIQFLLFVTFYLTLTHFTFVIGKTYLEVPGPLSVKATSSYYGVCCVHLMYCILADRPKISQPALSEIEYEVSFNAMNINL